jgi:hypothetical protein
MVRSATPASSAPATRASGGRGIPDLSTWLRLLVLLFLGAALVAPLVLAAARHWRHHEAGDTAEAFLQAVRDRQAPVVAGLLTPKARGTDALPVGVMPPAENGPAARVIGLFSGYLQGCTFEPGSSTREGESLVVQFVLHLRRTAPAGPPEPPQLPTGDQRAALFEAVQQSGVPLNVVLALADPARRVDGQEGHVRLRRADGRWRVSGLRLPPASAFPDEFDFEALAEKWVLTLPQGQAAAPSTVFDRLAPVTPAEFAAAWQVDVEAKDRPALEILQGLGAGRGRQSLPSGHLLVATQEGLDRHVSLSLHQVSRFEVVEEVGRRIELSPNYTANVLRFVPARRRLPAACAGPFLVEAATVTEDPPNATGWLPLRFLLPSFPPPVAAMLAMQSPSVSVLKVTGPGGEDLLNAPKGAGRELVNPTEARDPTSVFSQLQGGQRVQFWSVSLKNLLREVDSIAEVRLSVHLVLPREVRQLGISTIEPGSVATAGDVRLTLLKIETVQGRAGTRYSFRIEPPARQVCWQATPQSRVNGSGWSVPAASGEFDIDQSTQPTEFQFKVLGPGDEQSWECSLRDVPLSRPPRRLESPRFEGHAAPVRVAEARVTARGLELRVVNDCQKEFDGLDLKLTYLDAAGKTLLEAERNWTRSRSPPGRGAESSLVALNTGSGFAGEELLLLDNAARPEGTHSVSATVTGVHFKDATTWRP